MKNKVIEHRFCSHEEKYFFIPILFSFPNFQINSVFLFQVSSLFFKKKFGELML